MRSSSKIDLPLSHQYRTENFERYAKVKEIEERTVYAKRRKENSEKKAGRVTERNLSFVHNGKNRPFYTTQP